MAKKPSPLTDAELESSEMFEVEITDCDAQVLCSAEDWRRLIEQAKEANRLRAATATTVLEERKHIIYTGTPRRSNEEKE